VASLATELVSLMSQSISDTMPIHVVSLVFENNNYDEDADFPGRGICFCTVWYVAGTQVVRIFASKRIRVGEEITINYGESYHARDWS
jgi:hypothetical protein